jgi:cyclase
MLQTRVMPCLLLDEGGLLKTVSFKNPTYIGDAINSVRIYNELEVDEIIILDIYATKNEQGPNFAKISQLTEECFMPFTYGGGIKTYEDAQKLFDMGVEKISLNSAALHDVKLIEKIAHAYGSQAVVVSIDVQKTLFSGERVFEKCGTKKTKWATHEWAKFVENAGAGEILVNAIDRDGKMDGFDLNLISNVSDCVDIPVIAAGGAGEIEDIGRAKKAGANAIALGSMAVYQNKNRGILINFPEYKTLREVLGEK